MKKLGIVLIVTLVCFSNSFFVNAGSNKNIIVAYDDVRTDVLEKYENDEMFLAMQRNDPKAAEEYIDLLVKEKVRLLSEGKTFIAPYATTGGEFYSHVNSIMQSYGNYCGPAATLMVLEGIGLGDTVIDLATNYANYPNLVYSTDRIKKQNRLAADTFEGGSSSMVYKIATTGLNTRIKSGIKYEFSKGSDMTISIFKEHIKHSLTVDRPVILHVDTKELGYYNGVSLGHYIVLEHYSLYTNYVKVDDPNYDILYFGEHSVSIDQAYRSINEINMGTRYMIHAIDIY